MAYRRPPEASTAPAPYLHARDVHGACSAHYLADVHTSYLPAGGASLCHRDLTALLLASISVVVVLLMAVYCALQ